MAVIYYTDEELKERLADALRDLLDSLPFTYKDEQEKQINEVVESIFGMISMMIAKEARND